jgi:hypothetical protein
MHKVISPRDLFVGPSLHSCCQFRQSVACGSRGDQRRTLDGKKNTAGKKGSKSAGVPTIA